MWVATFNYGAGQTPALCGVDPGRMELVHHHGGQSVGSAVLPRLRSKRLPVQPVYVKDLAVQEVEAGAQSENTDADTAGWRHFTSTESGPPAAVGMCALSGARMRNLLSKTSCRPGRVAGRVPLGRGPGNRPCG